MRLIDLWVTLRLGLLLEELAAALWRMGANPADLSYQHCDVLALLLHHVSRLHSFCNVAPARLGFGFVGLH